MIELFSVLIVVFNSVAQVMLKKGALSGGYLGLYNRYVLAGYSLFVVVIAMSYYLLHHAALNYYAMLMCLSYVMTVVLSKAVFKTRLGRKQYSGIALIIVGALVFLQ